MEVYFPKHNLEKLINKYDGTLTERYEENGRTVEAHYTDGKGSFLAERTVYTGKPLDRANRETTFFKDGGKPYLRRVYRDNRLVLEQGLRGTVIDRSYEEKYEYNGDEVVPSFVIEEKFDENGKSLSVKKQKNLLKRASEEGAKFDFMKEKDLNWR